MTYALLINNDALWGEAIAAALHHAGIQTRLAGSESEAVPLIQERLPAVIVWDWPVTDVPAEIFIALLRQEGLRGALVICSPTLDLRDVPYDLLIFKPFEIEHLVKTVGRFMLEESGASDDLRATGC